MAQLKRIKAIVFFCFVLVQCSFAQTKVGILAGANIITCDCSDVFNSIGSNASAFGGLTVDIPVKNRWDFNVDLLLSEKGFSLDQSNAPNYEEKGFYFDLIPSIDFKLISKLYLTAGVQLNYKFVDFAYDGRDWNRIPKGISSFKDVDYGAVLGAKIKLKKFALTARYLKGFSDVLDVVFTDQNGIPIPDLHYKNQSIQIGLAYYFKK